MSFNCSGFELNWCCGVDGYRMREGNGRLSGPLSSSYINASYVRPPNYTATGAAVASSQDTQPEYIAAQGPLPHTVADFLTIIYEQRCPHIVMLCKGNNSPKCARYWPAQATETFVSDGRSVVVTKVAEQITPNFTYREFTILPSDEKEPWPVKQIHFTLWNDYGAPPVEQIYAVILKHLSFLEQTPIGSYGPPLVHCSAGVGRTGTFICARYILERLRKDASTIDVFGTALAVRRWRKSLVQTAVLRGFIFDFCYKI
uniref:Protein-tyrosine-phosphatase n=1 Tax=Mesocestoides corti TaxID=53468 RepID=A0A5K3FV85_MESCO